ncbi:hypothetical protein [Paraburkholderia sacchari]|uniref:hypothetical protein n=1 Tax=Paraburkholderia sacchari TaxID=159450 RepID=UPI0039A6EE9C
MGLLAFAFVGITYDEKLDGNLFHAPAAVTNSPSQRASCCDNERIPPAACAAWQIFPAPIN